MVMTFGEWLVQFSEEDSVLGDLASDFRLDCRLQEIEPSTFVTAEQLRQRMELQGACSESLEALEEAAVLYG
jgi:hypothetical protein